MRLLMVDVLEDDGYILDEFSNGMDAMKAISNSQPDMILLDVKMPVMNGFDVCSRIRESYGDINTSIVMVTGLEDSVSIEKAFKVGATAFISKPINWITFPHEIRYLLKARNAFVNLKQSETQLEHLDTISRIITQQLDRDTVLQESVHALLDIFTVDRAFIVYSADSSKHGLDIICEAVRDGIPGISQHKKAFINSLDENILFRASNSEYPLVSCKPETGNNDQGSEIYYQSQIIRSLGDAECSSWYLVMQKSGSDKNWSQLDHETFYRISIRLGSVLCQHLLLERLHRSEHQLRQAQHIGHIGNWSWNVKSGKLTWSDEMYRIYGQDPVSFTPSYDDINNIVFKNDCARLRKFQHAALDAGKTHSIEHRILLPSGEVRWVHEQAASLLDDNGELIEVNGVVQDITERLRKKEQEIHDHKMEAVGQLTSGIAHDFGNLMTIAHGNIQMLQKMLEESKVISDDFMDMFNDASSAINDGVQLTKQLLSFSRKKSIAPERLNINDIIINYRKLIENTLGDNIVLSLDIQQDLPEILVDPMMFVSSLINIIINARDAMPDGGLLSIAVELAETHSCSSSYDTAEDETGECICVSISDTGTGMPDSVLQHAIEPFYTTKQDGTGLGLSLAYSFMRQSGGDLSIDTESGTGTRVLMYFPACSAMERISTTAPVEHAKPSREFTILVVEDNPAVRQLAVRCLDNQGLNVLEASDAASAMILLKRNSNIDLLFTDVLMPGDMNGHELAVWAREAFPALNVLLTTAARKEAKYLLENRNDASQILLKPFSNQELVNKIMNILTPAAHIT
jgi:PAS domain S-box-containing protein